MLSFLLGLIVISLSGVMMPGPMFAVTVAKSYKSQFAGAKMAIGHAIIEVPLIFLIYLGVTRFFQQELVQVILSILGGLMIIWMGIDMFRARKKVIEANRDLAYNAVVAGVVMSALNPFFLLWWATVGSMLIMNSLKFGITGFALLIPTHWLCDLAWLSFVSVLIYKTKALWGKKFQEGLFIICSLLLVGFGTWFLASGLRTII